MILTRDTSILFSALPCFYSCGTHTNKSQAGEIGQRGSSSSQPNLSEKQAGGPPC